MPGATCSHPATHYLKSTTHPSTWTSTWSGTVPWTLYIWRVSMRPSPRATGRSRTTDTLVNIPQHGVRSRAVESCRCSHVSCCPQLCSTWAAACRWVVEVCQTCTTPSSCTSTGGRRPLMVQSTQWTRGDILWRYSTVSSLIHAVTDQTWPLTCPVCLTSWCRSLLVPVQMHIVNVKAVYPNLTAALDDPTGLAVLSFFIDVSHCEIESQ